MRKKMVGLLIGFLLVSVNAFAAGDLIVEGNLGVGTFGTASPTAKLQVVDSLGATQFSVAGDGTVMGMIGMFGDYVNPARSARTLNLISSSGGMRLWRVHDSWGPTMEFIHSTTATIDTKSSYWDIYTTPGPTNSVISIRDRLQGDLIRFTINASGNVGIGTTTPAYPLAMASGAHVTTGGVWTNASSREYKDNITELSASQALAAVRELNPVTFSYRVEANDKHVGFIAEDVPELVATKDRKGLSAMDIVAVLTKVVQEQQKEI